MHHSRQRGSSRTWQRYASAVEILDPTLSVSGAPVSWLLLVELSHLVHQLPTLSLPVPQSYPRTQPGTDPWWWACVREGSPVLRRLRRPSLRCSTPEGRGAP